MVRRRPQFLAALVQHLLLGPCFHWSDDRVLDLFLYRAEAELAPALQRTLGQSWPCRLRRQNDMLLASTSTKRGQSDFSVIPMGAPISRGGSLPTSAATTGVTTPPHTTATTGITALLTIGNTAAGSRQQGAGSRVYVPGRSPDWLKMKNANAPAVRREAEEDW